MPLQSWLSPRISTVFQENSYFFTIPKHKFSYNEQLGEFLSCGQYKFQHPIEHLSLALMYGHYGFSYVDGSILCSLSNDQEVQKIVNISRSMPPHWELEASSPDPLDEVWGPAPEEGSVQKNTRRNNLKLDELSINCHGVFYTHSRLLGCKFAPAHRLNGCTQGR